MSTATTTLFPWKDSYSIHNAEIDAQHKKLVNLLNALHEGMMSSSPNQRLQQLLAELVQYTIVHFSHEERLMQHSGYPGYKMHKLLHQDLTRQVIEFQEKFRTGKLALSLDLLHFLKTWLKDHIQGADQQFGRWKSSMP